MPESEDTVQPAEPVAIEQVSVDPAIEVIENPKRVQGVRKRPPAKRKPGRPPLLTAEVSSAILDTVRRGHTIKNAVALVNVCSYDSVQNWQAVGEEAWTKAGGLIDKVASDKRVFVEFFLDMKKAKNEFIDANLKIIAAAGPKQWQASAWLLERTNPGLFSVNRGEIARLQKELGELSQRLAELMKASRATREEGGKDAEGQSV